MIPHARTHASLHTAFLPRTDAARLGAALGRPPALWPLPQAHRPEIVSKRSDARAVLRQAQHGRTPELYAKTSVSAQTASQAHARARRIHRAHALHCAPPKALDPDRATLWTLWVRRDSLAGSLRKGFDAGVAERVVEALAVLPLLPWPSAPRVRRLATRGCQQEVGPPASCTHGIGRALVQLHPDLPGQCTRYMNQLDAALAAIAS